MALTVTPSSIYDGRVGEEYSHQMAASGGTAPYSFAVTSGALPTGLILNASTGLISGTPTTVTADVPNFTITATDSAGSPDTGTRTYSDLEIIERNRLTNSVVDGAAAKVPAPYGPLTRVTDVETGQNMPNIDTPLVLTTQSGTQVKCFHRQLIDAEAIQRQLALVTGRDYIMNQIKTKITTLNTYFSGISESDGEGYSQAEYEEVINQLRGIHQTSGFYEKVSSDTFWS